MQVFEQKNDFLRHFSHFPISTQYVNVRLPRDLSAEAALYFVFMLVCVVCRQKLPILSKIILF